MLKTKFVGLVADEESTPSSLISISEANGFPGCRAKVFVRNVGEGPIHVGCEESPAQFILNYSIAVGETLELDVSSELHLLARGAVSSGSGPTTGTDRQARVLAISKTNQDYKIKAV